LSQTNISAKRDILYFTLYFCSRNSSTPATKTLVSNTKQAGVYDVGNPIPVSGQAHSTI